MSKTSIEKCPRNASCKPHEYQDSKYGNYNRVMNEGVSAAKQSNVKLNCTVCGQTITKDK